MNVKKRESKRIPKYEQEEIVSFQNNPIHKKNEITEFIKFKKLSFELNKKQKKLIEELGKNEISIITGAPGTSKTFIACYVALQHLLQGKCKKIILSKPTEVLSGTKDVGALPGNLDDKMSVYAESFFDAFEEFMSTKDFKHLWDEKIIEFKPAQFMRGRSFKDSFIIIDEAQNFDSKALKSIITRLSHGSTMLFLGDAKQNDIKKKFVAIEMLKEIVKPIKGCYVFEFTREDIVRKKILIDIVDRFEKFEELGKLTDTIKET